MKQVYINDTNIISPLGFSVEENFENLLNGHTGIRSVTFPEPMGSIFAGKINDEVFNPFFQNIDPTFTGSRIERLMIAALDAIVRKNPITQHALLIVSTTKGNIRALEDGNSSEAALNHTAQNVANYFGFQQQPIIVSNACVSGVMALSVAKRFIQMNQATDVYIIAVDELTAFTVSGFQSFQAMSNEICQPFDQERKGVNLGEASVAAYVSSEKKE
ncbi:MAG TPA: beta-ketoacyl synthase N-terminal-like domain-containing protein, partial [Flavobacterium sp.]|nr:beta-ketoacyl synthase N-terminal-like domain-containing protein [Flavobacterium sp.]